MRQKIVTAAAALSLAFGLSGCIGGGAAVALGTAASMAGIAKDVFDVDISIHSLFGHPKTEPIPPAALITHPEYIVVPPSVPPN